MTLVINGDVGRRQEVDVDSSLLATGSDDDVACRHDRRQINRDDV